MLAELATVKAVASPHVVRTFEAFMVQLDGLLTFFLTLELCDGGDLGHRLARARGRARGASAAAAAPPAAATPAAATPAAAAAPPAAAAPLDEAVAARWALELAAGLAAVHKAHVAHRDLKPANALLSSAADADARVKISDFGLARQAFAGDEALGGSAAWARSRTRARAARLARRSATARRTTASRPTSGRSA